MNVQCTTQYLLQVTESPALHECSVYNSVFTTSESTALHECSVYNSVFTTSY